MIIYVIQGLIIVLIVHCSAESFFRRIVQNLLRNARIEAYSLQDLFQSELIIHIQVLLIDYKQPLAILMIALITRRQMLLFSQLESSQPQAHAQQTQDVQPMLAVYWATGCDAWLTLTQHLLNLL